MFSAILYETLRLIHETIKYGIIKPHAHIRMH